MFITFLINGCPYLFVVFAIARAKTSLFKFFKAEWGMKRKEVHSQYRFDTIKSAVSAFNNRTQEEPSPTAGSYKVWNTNNETGWSDPAINLF